LLSRGKELDVNADSEVIRRLDEIRKQNHMDSMEALEKAVRDSGISFEDFKSNIKNQVITQEVVRDEVGRTLRLTAKDEQAYYDAHKEEFAQPEQVRLSEILVPTPDDATDAQVAQAQAKANDVIAKLTAGTKFEDLVKQYSGGPNPDLGGDLGQFKRGQLGSKLLEDPTFALPAGKWTSPIRTRQGFIILKVTEHTQPGVLPLSAVDEQVQEAIYAQAIQPALRTYLTKLREDAYIDIAPGFVDTGASPKETKPVFSGATPPPTKKKTAAQKARMTTGRGAAKAPATASAPAPATSTGTPSPSTETPALAVAPSTAPSGKPVTMSSNKKPKKIRREKIRYGQAPRDSLPSAPEETLAPGADQGVGATASALAAPGVAIAPTTEQASNSAADENPLTPSAEHKKTRYSDRAPIEAKEKAAKKVAAVKQKAALKPAPLTPEETAAQKAQDAPLGLGGDTATKKKKKREKGQPKERIQQKAPEPPAPKPEATPIPPKSVRDNGEPVVTPVTPPAPGPPIDTPSTQPATPSNPNPPATQPPTAAPQL
jgi:peptidyl-prolyl cis-trans isomerase SurA